MKRNLYRRASGFTSAALLALTLLAGCGDEPTNPDDSGGNNANDTAKVLMTFNIRTMAGAEPFLLDSTFTSDAGISYKVSKFIYYIHGITLMDSAGKPVLVTLVDADQKPLPYNINLVNYEQPETMTLRVMAPRGNYTGVRFSVGVPMFDAAGVKLNHEDASAMEYPLNVDADMYWGWKVGYIFLKIEGSSRDKGDWQSFFYHVGDDKRLMPIAMNAPFAIAKNGTSSRTLEVNVNKLFTTPTGEHSPNIAGTLEERTAHSGPTADIVSNNAMNSGFFTLKP